MFRPAGADCPAQPGFYLGCAVWAYKDWVGNFYPPSSASGEFLRLYGARFTAVEGNTTFYSVPGPAMVERWVQGMPQTFRFCPKLPRDISHNGLLEQGFEETRSFLERLAPLGLRLGPVFAQLPPSYSPAKFEDLQRFVAAWPSLVPEGLDLPLSVEVRHPGWFQPGPGQQLNDLLRSHQTGRVLLDTRALYDGSDDPQQFSQRRKPNLPLQPERTADFTLVRWITHPLSDRNRPYLRDWAERIAQWLSQGTTVYFFVHCPDEVYSPNTARQFQRQLEAEGERLGVPIPPLPWDSLAQPPAQLSLF